MVAGQAAPRLIVRSVCGCAADRTIRLWPPAPTVSGPATGTAGRARRPATGCRYWPTSGHHDGHDPCHGTSTCHGAGSSRQRHARHHCARRRRPGHWRRRRAAAAARPLWQPDLDLEARPCRPGHPEASSWRLAGSPGQERGDPSRFQWRRSGWGTHTELEDGGTPAGE